MQAIDTAIQTSSEAIGTLASSARSLRKVIPGRLVAATAAVLGAGFVLGALAGVAGQRAWARRRPPTDTASPLGHRLRRIADELGLETRDDMSEGELLDILRAAA